MCISWFFVGRSAAASISGLHTDRNSVVSARMEALELKEKQIHESQEKMLAEIRESMLSIDQQFVADLTVIAADSASS